MLLVLGRWNTAAHDSGAAVIACLPVLLIGKVTYADDGAEAPSKMDHHLGCYHKSKNSVVLTREPHKTNVPLLSYDVVARIYRR